MELEIERDAEGRLESKCSTNSNTSSITPLIKYFNSLRDSTVTIDAFNVLEGENQAHNNPIKRSSLIEIEKPPERINQIEEAKSETFRFRKIFGLLTDGLNVPESVSRQFKSKESIYEDLELKDDSKLLKDENDTHTYRSKRRIVSEKLGRMLYKKNLKENEAICNGATKVVLNEKSVANETLKIYKGTFGRQLLSKFFKWRKLPYMEEEVKAAENLRSESNHEINNTEQKEKHFSDSAFLKLDDESYHKIAKSKNTLYENCIFSPNGHRATLKDIPSIEDLEASSVEDIGKHKALGKEAMDDMLDEDIRICSTISRVSSLDEEVELHLQLRSGVWPKIKRFKRKTKDHIEASNISHGEQAKHDTGQSHELLDSPCSPKVFDEGLTQFKEAFHQKYIHLYPKTHANPSPISMENNDHPMNDEMIAGNQRKVKESPIQDKSNQVKLEKKYSSDYDYKANKSKSSTINNMPLQLSERKENELSTDGINLASDDEINISSLFQQYPKERLNEASNNA